MPTKVWRPYIRHLDQTGELDELKLSNPRGNPREEFDLGPWLYVVKWPSFTNFAQSKFGRGGLSCIQEHQKTLAAINAAANTHHKTFQPLSREKARGLFFKAVGVGSPGIIQHLMNLGEAPR